MSAEALNRVNLLPRQAVRLRRARLARRLWAGVLGVALPGSLALVVASGLAPDGGADDLRHQIEEIDREIERRLSLIPSGESDRTRALTRRDTTPLEWAGMLRALSHLAGDDIGFNRLSVEVGGSREVLISVEGRAGDSRHVLAFASEVERTGLFAPMDAPEITPDAGGLSVRFSLDVRIDAVASADGGVQ